MLSAAAELAASLIVLARGITACFGALCIVTKVVAPIVGLLLQALDSWRAEANATDHTRRSQRLAARPYRQSKTSARDAVAASPDYERSRVNSRRHRPLQEVEEVTMLVQDLPSKPATSRLSKRVLRPITDKSSNLANRMLSSASFTDPKQRQSTILHEDGKKVAATKSRVLSLGNIFDDDDIENVAPFVTTATY
ncbi:hypothetical protein ATCC90586_001063 [Pythium insidiosum]|nr:hypothetical protein ATCC90586_001063 [Pythium insidiosum]